MFKKSFVAIAMLSVFFTATAFGQKEIVVWQAAKGTPKSERKTTINASDATAFTGSDEELGALVAWRSTHRNSGRKPKTSSLIDTSTGEIMWADEFKAKQPNSSNGRAATGTNQRTSQSRNQFTPLPKGISFNFDKMIRAQANRPNNQPTESLNLNFARRPNLANKRKH